MQGCEDDSVVQVGTPNFSEWLNEERQRPRRGGSINVPPPDNHSGKLAWRLESFCRYADMRLSCM